MMLNGTAAVLHATATAGHAVIGRDAEPLVFFLPRESSTLVPAMELFMRSLFNESPNSNSPWCTKVTSAQFLSSNWWLLLLLLLVPVLIVLIID